MNTIFPGHGKAQEIIQSRDHDLGVGGMPRQGEKKCRSSQARDPRRAEYSNLLPSQYCAALGFGQSLLSNWGGISEILRVHLAIIFEQRYLAFGPLTCG